MSKFLVCEDDHDSLEKIKQFCSVNNLLPLKMASADNLGHVLASHLDLGGVFLSETFGAYQKILNTLEHARAEIPLFVRRECSEHLSTDLPHGVAGEFTFETLEDLKTMIEETIFSTYYPEHLIQRMREISISMMENQFVNTRITCDLPYLVMDHMIFGKLMSLIPIESVWCRGYMTLQAEKAPITAAINAGLTHLNLDEYDDGFRSVTSLVGELTNLIWGAMKNEFFTMPDEAILRTQVPILINHDLKHISFGSTTPQLCFCYQLDSPSLPPVLIYQRFIFNLAWDPERFEESCKAEEELVDSGELEFF